MAFYNSRWFLASLIIITSAVAIYFLWNNAIMLIRKFRDRKEVKIKQGKPFELIDTEKLVTDEIKKEDDIKKLDKSKFYVEAEPFEYFKTKRSKWNIRYWRDKRIAKKSPGKAVLIRFEYNNKRHTEFLMKEDKGSFMYDGGRYALDLEASYFVISSNIWAYDFHESLAIPVKKDHKLNQEFINEIQKKLRQPSKRKIPVDEIKELLEHSNVTEVQNSVNPVTLERLIKSEIVQAIMQGAAIGKLFRIFLIILIGTIMLIFGDLLIDLYDSGIFTKVVSSVQK